MSVTIIFKIAALGIVVAVLSQILKHSGREEQAFLLSLAGLIIVLFWIVPCISELFTTMLVEMLGVGYRSTAAKFDYGNWIRPIMGERPEQFCGHIHEKCELYH